MRFGWICLICITSLAAAEPRKTCVCVYTDTAVTIDGRLDDVAWERAVWTDNFVDIEGRRQPRPRFRTRVKMLWDDKCFYIGAEMEEPHVWATITKRDDVIFHDNDFELFLDPNGDNHEYGEFEINALNTGWDLFLPKPYKDGGSAQDAWNINGIQTAVHIHGTLNNPADLDSGWSVEIALPWPSLEKISHIKNPPEDGNQWRINFSRVEWTTVPADGKYRKLEGKPEDNWVWSPQGVINMHRPEMWGIVQFSSKYKGIDSVRSDPYENARQVLHAVYYAEHDYHKRHDAWSTDVNLLGVAATTTQITLTDSGFIASLDVNGIQAHIRHDSYFWVDSIKSR